MDTAPTNQYLPQAALPSLRRLQLSIPVEADHSKSSHAEQRPTLRLHYSPDEVDIDYDDYDEPIYSRTQLQTISSAAELYYAVRSYAAKHAVDVALDDDGCCVVFDRF